MRLVLLSMSLVLLFRAYPPRATGQNPLVGSWKLVSTKVAIDSGEPQDVFGTHPKGYLILTPEGRMMTVGTSDSRRAGFSDAEQAELEKSMFAYTGRYRIEGNDFVTTVDVSWNEAWNGTKQRRHYKLEGDKLTIVTVPQPSPIDPSQTVTATLVWEREK